MTLFPYTTLFRSIWHDPSKTCGCESRRVSFADFSANFYGSLKRPLLYAIFTRFVTIKNTFCLTLNVDHTLLLKRIEENDKNNKLFDRYSPTRYSSCSEGMWRMWIRYMIRLSCPFVYNNIFIFNYKYYVDDMLYKLIWVFSAIIFWNFFDRLTLY